MRRRRRIPHLPHDKPVGVDRDTGGRGGLDGLGQASGEGDVGGALRPGGRPAAAGSSPSGTAASRTPQSVVRAAIADGPGAAFGPPEDVSAAGRDGAASAPLRPPFSRPTARSLGRRLETAPRAAADAVAQAYVR